MAQIAFKQDNVKEVRAAVNALAADHPDRRRDWVKAEEEIKKRRVWGCPPKPRNNSWTRAFTRAQTWRFFYYSLYLVGAWIVGLVALFALGKLFSNLTLRSIEEADPNGRPGRPGRKRFLCGACTSD